MSEQISFKEKRNRNTTTKLFSAGLILLLTLSILLISAPNVASQTIKMSFNVTTIIYPYIGINSPMQIAWVPTSATTNPFANSPAYKGLKSVWPDAIVTFTRPDGTKDVVNGPLKGRPSGAQGRTPDVALIYTPNMKGRWNVSLYWPGDSTYNALIKNDTFNVGEHYPKRTTWAYLSLNPYPAVGVGQSLLINAWVTPAPIVTPDYYENYMFTFTSPSGTSFEVGPMDSELPGTVWFDLPLTEVGNWTIKFEFPGDHFSSASAITRAIIVQQNPVPVGYPDTPLPTESWEFPINVQNREWRNIAGPWYQAHYNASVGAWNPYTEAPKTPHVLWKLPAESGIGGYIGAPHSIQTGSGEIAYGAGDVGIYTSTVPTIRTVMNGRGYYSLGGKITSVDMRTGEKLWTVPGSFNLGAVRGRSPVLYQFGPRFVVYDAMTGAVTLNVTGASMTFFDNPYVYQSANKRLIKWTTEGNSDNFTSRIIWNVSDPVPIGLAIYSYSTITDGLWVGVTDNATVSGSLGLSIRAESIVAINTTTGEIAYNNQIGDPTDPNTYVYREGPATGSGYGLLYFADVPYKNEGLGYVAFNVSTGKQAWVSESADPPWGNFWAYMPLPSGYGMIYASGYSGVYAFNATNGDIVWHYIAEDPNYEEPYQSNTAPNGTSYGSFTFGSTGAIVGGGVVFAPDTEHSATFIYRNQQLHAIDAFTGEKLWSLLGVYAPTAIAYGTLLASDSNNGFTYAFGKGGTSTSLSAQNDVYAKGATVLLKGSVLDMSTAQRGTAAIADDYQEEWMEYMHMQQQKPTDATGVTVRLTAIDPNGNNQDIGTVTSDLSGNYAIAWTPPLTGLYKIKATFAGSESYYGSEAETVFVVAEATASATPTQPSVTSSPTSAPTSTPAPTSASPSPVVLPPTSGLAVEAYIAVGAAIVIITAAAAALIIRKRRKPLG